MKKLLVLLLLSGMSRAYAQEAAGSKTLSGMVTETGAKKALPGAVVRLLNPAGGEAAAGTTSDKGSFALPVKDTGHLKLVITHSGYKQQVIAVHVGADFGGWHLGTIALQPGEGLLAEVVVRTSRPMVEQKADRLVYNAERDLSTLGGTAADVLRNVPMLSVDGNDNVQLRGSSNVRVLINNRPSSLIATSVADALRQLPADMIKSVEVITAPSAKYDAEGSAGIINIITKKNLLQGLTGNLTIVPGNVSTIGNAGLNFRRPAYGLNFSAGINQFYNTGTTHLERRSLFVGAGMQQDGRTKNHSGFVSPRIGFDWTLDQQQSISGGFAYNPSFNKVQNRQSIMNFDGGDTVYQSTLLFNHTTVTGYDMNLDYLRTFKNPQQEFTFLTLYSLTNADNISNQDLWNAAEVLQYLQRNTNKSHDREATFQADYTHPFKNKTLLETGAKLILREAGSRVDYESTYLPGNKERRQDIFSYTQKVWSGYLLYGYTLAKKLQVKMGARYEATALQADFESKGFAFEVDYGNLIPSLNMSYTFGERHSLRAGYSRRLQRPQLYYLNPYREVLAPKFIRQGNPELDPELTDLLEIGYGTYTPRFSLNTSLFARLTSNGILADYALQEDTTVLRFLNVARNRTYGLSLSGSWKIFKSWSVNGNANVYHATMSESSVKNSGWMYNIFVGSNLDLGRGWSHGFTGSFNSRRINLRGRFASFYYHNTTLRKDLWNRKGSIGINLANPLMKGTRVRNDFTTDAFYQMEDNINYTRGIRLSFTYRFGQLQQAKPPRKPKKTISNDDALRG